MSVRPAKKAWFLSYSSSAQQRLWSDWADAQIDLSLRWAHMPFLVLSWGGSFLEYGYDLSYGCIWWYLHEALWRLLQAQYAVLLRPGSSLVYWRYRSVHTLGKKRISWYVDPMIFDGLANRRPLLTISLNGFWMVRITNRCAMEDLKIISSMTVFFFLCLFGNKWCARVTNQYYAMNQFIPLKWNCSLYSLLGQFPQRLVFEETMLRRAAHEFLCLIFSQTVGFDFIVLRKLILQTRRRSHPMGLDVWFLVGPFAYFHCSCMRTPKALARLRGCAGSPEPSLVAYVISTLISWAGSFYLHSYPLCQYSDLLTPSARFAFSPFCRCWIYEPRHEKTWICHMRTTKAQISLCCSLPGEYNTSTCYSRTFKTLASLISWAGRFES